MTKEKTTSGVQSVTELIEEKLSMLLVENRNLKKELLRLERTVARVAHHTGTDNILKAYGIDTYKPGREDMRKWRG